MPGFWDLFTSKKTHAENMKDKDNASAAAREAHERAMAKDQQAHAEKIKVMANHAEEDKRQHEARMKERSLEASNETKKLAAAAEERKHRDGQLKVLHEQRMEDKKNEQQKMVLDNGKDLQAMKHDHDQKIKSQDIDFGKFKTEAKRQMGESRQNHLEIMEEMKLKEQNSEQDHQEKLKKLEKDAEIQKQSCSTEIADLGHKKEVKLKEIEKSGEVALKELEVKKAENSNKRQEKLEMIRVSVEMAQKKNLEVRDQSRLAYFEGWKKQLADINTEYLRLSESVSKSNVWTPFQEKIFERTLDFLSDQTKALMAKLPSDDKTPAPSK